MKVIAISTIYCTRVEYTQKYTWVDKKNGVLNL
jgi:hypothetical protein